MITVQELINELEKFDKDLPVMVDMLPLDDVYLDEEFYFGGDPRHINDIIGPAVVLRY